MVGYITVGDLRRNVKSTTIAEDVRREQRIENYGEHFEKPQTTREWLGRELVDAGELAGKVVGAEGD